MWIKFRDELNTCLKIVHQIFSAIQKYVKYLYISNNIFTMMSAPDKKMFKEFSTVFANKYHIFYQYGVWTFVSWILKLFHQSKLELWVSKLRKKTGPLLFKVLKVLCYGKPHLICLQFIQNWCKLFAFIKCVKCAVSNKANNLHQFWIHCKQIWDQ